MRRPSVLLPWNADYHEPLDVDDVERKATYYSTSTHRFLERDTDRKMMMA